MYLASHEQLDLRCLLNIAHPLTIDTRGADEELVPVENEPNRNFVWFPGLAPIMGQPRRLLSGYPPQSRKLG